MNYRFKRMNKVTLIKQFHILLHNVGFNGDDKQDILSEYGVTSSKDLNESQLSEINRRLEAMLPAFVELDKYRKRVIKVIAEYLDRQGKECNIDYIKAIACRAAEAKTFNAIPLAKLRAVYSQFLTFNKVGRKVEDINEEMHNPNGITPAQERILNNIKPLGNA